MSVVPSLPTEVFFRHRARIERDVGAPEAAPGYEAVPDWQVLHTDIKCLLWGDYRVGRTGLFDLPTGGYILALYRMMVPKGSGVQEGDRITKVVDMRGETFFEGNIEVDAVLERVNYTVLFGTERR